MEDLMGGFEGDFEDEFDQSDLEQMDLEFFKFLEQANARQQ